MSQVIRLMTVLSILATCSSLQANTTLLAVTGSGEFVSKSAKVFVAAPPAAGAFQLFWSTTAKGVVGLSWEVSTGSPATVVLSGKQMVASGVTQGLFYVSSAFLSAQPPANPKTYEIRVTPFNAQQNALGPPSSPVTVTQQMEKPSPPTKFGNNAVFPSLELLRFQAHVDQVPGTQIMSVTATLKVRVRNKGKVPTDPMWLSIVDKNHLVVAKAPAALPKMKPTEKPVEVTLQLAPLLPASKDELESSRYDAWDASLRSKGVDIDGVLDWRGPVQNSPMSTHLDVPLYQGKMDSCLDGKLDGDEALVDCGGSCSNGRATAFNLCSNHLDINGLQLNPIWEWQITHQGQTPDFQATCGADPSTCTSQSVLFDVVGPTTLPVPVPGAVFIPDSATLCGGNPFSGHANWEIATFEGTVDWDSHESSTFGDDDYNMSLYRNDQAALTTLSSGLGLEFNYGETVSGFSSPWWTSFRSSVSRPGPGGHVPSQMINGHYAIVTGLIGIDGVHGGWTESHPVFSLAILTGQTNAGAATEQNWSLFVRNWGNEGFCSEEQHYWDTTNGDYWVQLRWPKGATAVEVDQSKTKLFASQAGLAPPSILRDPNTEWLYVLFALPGPGQRAYVEGDLTLHYTFPAGKMHKRPPIDLTKRIKPSHKAQFEKEGFAASTAQIADPQTRVRFERVLHEWLSAQVPRGVDRIPVVVSPTVRTYQPLEGRRAPTPGRDRAVKDQERVKQQEDLHRRMEVEFGKQIP